MKKLIVLVTMFSSLFGYQVCESYVSRYYKVVCLNGDEYFVYTEDQKGGMAKTGYQCKCIKKEGFMVDKYKVVRK